MGDVIQISNYLKRRRTRESKPKFFGELCRLWEPTKVWTPYLFALEKQNNERWEDLFFFPDFDW